MNKLRQSATHAFEKKRGRSRERPLCNIPPALSLEYATLCPRSGRIFRRRRSPDLRRTGPKQPVGWVHSKGNIGVLPPASQRAFAEPYEMVPRCGILRYFGKRPRARNRAGPSVPLAASKVQAPPGPVSELQVHDKNHQSEESERNDLGVRDDVGTPSPLPFSRF